MDNVINLTDTLSNSGTLEFTLRFDRDWANGYTAKKEHMKLFSLENICDVSIKNNGSMVSLDWHWNTDFSKKNENASNFNFMMPSFPGSKDIKMLYTWDAGKGLFDAYMNGWPLRIPGSKFTPWSLHESNKLIITPGEFSLSNIKSHSSYMDKEEVAKTMPTEGDNPFALSAPSAAFTSNELEQRRGELLYDNDVSDPDFSNWVAEGPLASNVALPWVSFRSEMKSNSALDGHIVWWCREEFPESFIAEWDIKMETEPGLCIVFFAASGANGESIFDPSLKPRDGNFSQYILGDIVSYHISYYTNTPFNPGRIQANLRKNNRFFLMSQGPGGITPGSQEPHHVTLVKDKGRIWLSVDNKTLIAFNDDGGERYGKIYGGGRIGLRQMRWARAAYKGFKVWELKQ